jgi:hypothetical protein
MVTNRPLAKGPMPKPDIDAEERNIVLLGGGKETVYHDGPSSRKSFLNSH